MLRAKYAANYIGEKNRSGLKKVFKPGDPHTIEVDYHETSTGSEIISVRRQSHHHAEATYANQEEFDQRLGSHKDDTGETMTTQHIIILAIVFFGTLVFCGLINDKLVTMTTLFTLFFAALVTAVTAFFLVA